MRRLFLDANVLFSAALTPSGQSFQLWALGRVGLCELVTSEYAVREVRRNLGLKAAGALEVLERELLPMVQRVSDPSLEMLKRLEDCVDPKDVPILAAAVACGADELVTGDRRHFGAFYGSEIEGVRILSPRMAVEMMVSEAEMDLGDSDVDVNG